MAVGTLMKLMANNSRPFRKSTARSTRATAWNNAWWLTQRIRMVSKDTAYAASEGSCSARADQMSAPGSGTCSSSTSNVAAIAIT